MAAMNQMQQNAMMQQAAAMNPTIAAAQGNAQMQNNNMMQMATATTFKKHDAKLTDTKY